MRRRSALCAVLLGRCWGAAAASTAARHQTPTAIRKLPPDANEKLHPEHLGFAPSHELYLHPRFPTDAGFEIDRAYHPAFALHYDEEPASDFLRRAAEALALLDRRSSCPSSMQSCADIQYPDKCCEDGTRCTYVSDSAVGHVACCPDGLTCGGRVGDCPSDAVTCPADLGGGCCIAGYICQGAGCESCFLACHVEVVRLTCSGVPSPSSSAASTVVTQVEATTRHPQPDTVTSTRTTYVEGSPSTVIVTLTVTRTASHEPATRTSTETVVPTESTVTVTGVAPYRPISSSTATQSPETTSSPVSQTGCPTGFYGCLATAGGGCCRTSRDCSTYDCPAPSLSTIVSDGKTIIVAGSAIPASATSTCADGWFICGADAGPVAGCCPSGYSCGTVSCFTVSSSQTETAQKELPKKEGGADPVRGSKDLLALVVAAALLVTMV